MKIKAALVAALGIYLLPLVALADDADDAREELKEAGIDPDAVEEDKPTRTLNIARPTFSPKEIPGAKFFEQFTDDWQKRWRISHAKKDVKTDEEWQYSGEWSVEEPTIYKGIDGDKGLVVKNEAAHHAISAKFPKAIDPKGKTLVVQYEVKFQDGLECGGAYLKLLKETKDLHKTEFSNASPYVIMFGPDKCGSTNKVHFIFKHKNPLTGEYEEKHLEDDVGAHVEKVTTLYTLVVNPDQTFQVLVNGEEERKGTLLDSFDPPVNPPKEIDDPDDKKPDDWVDLAQMNDPDAKKPDDWDEDAPYEVVDEEATKPDDWLEDEPDMISDPDATKPESWDDEEDGDWTAPMVPNPKCAEASGCGPWSKPMKRNPDYKGPWTPPQIDNPKFKGPWKPRKIPNKGYFEDNTPANFEPMGAIGIELWTMQANILFDNIYIGHSLEEATTLKNATFDIKKPLEDKQEDFAEEREDDAVVPEPTVLITENPVLYVRQWIEIFWPRFKVDPLGAVKEMPQVAGAIVAAGLAVVFLVMASLGLGASSPAVQETAKKAKNEAAKAKDKAAEAASTGIDKAQDATKRATRSSGGSDS